MDFKQMTIGQRIKWKREHEQLGLRECAQLIGCAPSTLRELESGESKCPSGKVLIKMCEVLKVTEGWIVNGEDGRLERINAQEAEALDEFRQVPSELREAALAILRQLRNRQP